jgi:hypothetical protein
MSLEDEALHSKTGLTFWNREYAFCIPLWLQQSFKGASIIMNKNT